MSQLGIRSPSAKVDGLVYFGRMLDKIRAHEKNELPPDYQANLGRGFDEFCTKFLHVHYHDVVGRVKEDAGPRKRRSMSGMNSCGNAAGMMKSARF
jgi:hypothetical protein